MMRIFLWCLLRYLLLIAGSTGAYCLLLLMSCLWLSTYVPIAACVDSIIVKMGACCCQQCCRARPGRCPSLDCCPAWLLLCAVACVIACEQQVVSVALRASTMTGYCILCGNRFTITCQSSSTYTYVPVCGSLYPKSCYN